MKLDLHALNRWNPSEANFITIDQVRCVSCGACVRACVARIWSLGDHSRAVLAPDYRQRCLECGACDQVCDARAIRFRYPPGGTGVVFEQG
jgi:ferredoxin-like protein FixX